MNELIEDFRTDKLIWYKPLDVELTWANAMEKAKSLGVRLPTPSEIFQLIESGKFRSIKDSFWSGLLHPDYSSNAYYFGGNSGSVYGVNLGYSLGVRCVKEIKE